MAKRNDTEGKKAGTDQYAAMVGRMLRAYGRRARETGGMDIDALTQLAAIQKELDQQTEEVVAALRADGYSWSDIGGALGLDRSAAYRRYHHLDTDTARKPGGQPGHLR